MAQCARLLILLEKWGAKTLISSMQSYHLGTISSHSEVRLVPLDLVRAYLSRKILHLWVLEWLILKECDCEAL